MGLTALWVGDSFTRGEGAGVAAPLTYPYLVGDRLGWRCHVDAQNGTGFVNDGFLAGPGLAPLPDRLPATAGTVAPDLVVVDAGRNDAGVPDPVVRESVTRYLAALRSTFVRAQVVVVLPTLLGPWQPPEYRVVAAVLRQVADQDGAQVVDPCDVDGFADPGDGEALVCPDGFHPSAAGQRHYAEVLAQLLAPVAGRAG